MVVDVVGVHVSGNHTLVALKVLRKLGSFKIQRVVRGEVPDDVVVATAVRFVKLLLDRFELVTRSLRRTVHAGDEGVGGLLRLVT